MSEETENWWDKPVRYLYVYENVKNTGPCSYMTGGMVMIPHLSLKHYIDGDISRIALYALDDQDAQLRIARYLNVRCEDAPQYQKRVSLERENA